MAWIGVTALAALAPSSAPASEHGSTLPLEPFPPGLCSDYVPCPVDVPDAVPGTGDVSILVNATRSTLTLTMHSWVAVRGECDGARVLPVSGRRSANVFQADVDFRVGGTVDCDVQINDEFVDVTVTFDPPDVDAVRDRCDLWLLMVGCWSGSEWFTYEPSAVFPGPVALAIVGELPDNLDDWTADFSPVSR